MKLSLPEMIASWRRPMRTFNEADNERAHWMDTERFRLSDELEAALNEIRVDDFCEYSTAIPAPICPAALAQQAQPEDLPCELDGKYGLHSHGPKQPETPTREVIAEAIWRGGDHWSVHEWPLRKLQETEAWECYLRQADAVLALFAPKGHDAD
jgi:hypothetical protein